MKNIGQIVLGNRNKPVWYTSIGDATIIGQISVGSILAGTPQTLWLSVGGVLADAPQTYW
jgi:hypothetical protein